MPTVDQKPVVKSSNSKRGSLTSDKTKKAKKKKKTKKSAKLESKEGLIHKDVNSLEIEGTCYQNDDDTDDSSSTKTPRLPKLSVSDITVKCKTTPRPVSTDSQISRFSNTRQTDSKTAVPRSKSQSADSFSAKLSNISLKNKNSKSKNKTGSAGKKDSGSAKTKKTDEKQTPAALNSVMPNIVETQKNVSVVSESVRWENELTGTDMERERIHLYKINRRKRYLAAAQLKGLGWVKQYGVNGFPLSEDTSVDVRKEGGISEFSTVSIIRTSQKNISLLGDAKAISIGH
ncbi:uncharacterized protein LOC130013207 [Patella vulgata]|uniref:uncharacterized protein LOC130013207 n=1 Tax=Patella vulgata TaxID=6465 RepID=UPI0024A98004|nr:uncharacterized protein LOC130013207 [Patella vulgata]